MTFTILAKMFVLFLMLGVVGYTGWHFFRSEDKPLTPARTKIVVGVNDFGGAYAGVVANDGALAGARSRFAAAGLDVEFKVIRGSTERLAAFDAGEVDVMLLTLDYLANVVPKHLEDNVKLKAFLMADWSRGNLGIVARPNITSIEGLKDAKVATTRKTPTHYLLLTLLEKSNLLPDQIENVKSNIVVATKTPLIVGMFQRGEVDAAAIWEPYLSQAMAGGKGHLLVSTATATNLIPDVLFARESFLKEHEAEMISFARAWFEGAALLKRDPEGWVKTLSPVFGQSPGEVRNLIKKTKPATFADNREFFGLEKERAPYLWLFEDASRLWQKEGVIKAAVDAASTRWLKPLEALSKDHREESVKEDFQFDKCSTAVTSSPALLTKSVSILYPTNAQEPDATAKRVIDDYAKTLTEFANTCVRIDGNTDNVGVDSENVMLSHRRAQAVVDYLVRSLGFDRARFLPSGNGAAKPVRDNATPEGREKNRRTDFKLIVNE